ncbi:caspase family protein [Roseibium sp. M-1]
MKRLLCFLLLLYLGLTTAQAERRVALVIGNSGYQHVAELKNPYNDAQGMTEKLTGLGFEVVTGQDLSLRDMRQTVREFARKLDGADLALFFYAGHGLQVNGENYLVPIDAQLSSYIDLEFEALPANLVLNAMEQTAKVNLVFLDACRNNPFAENLARSMGTRSGAVGRGLAKIGSGVGSLISFATQPGNVAQDGDGRNSPFTTALLKHLGTPGQDITRDLVMVRRDVLEATKGQQVPWDNSSLTGDVILRAEVRVDVTASAEPQTPPDNPQIEYAFWDSIKSGESTAYFETYLKRYPEGQFAEIARIRIDEIRTRSEEAKKRDAQQSTSAEIAFWQSIQNSTRQEMFESYLSRYPSGIYAELASLKIEAIKQGTQAPVQTHEGTHKLTDREAAANVEATDRQPEGGLSTAALSQPIAPSTAKSVKEPVELTPKELASALQTELNRLGCSAGRVDGDWGARSRQALRTFSREAGIELASLDPSPELLARVKQSTGRICPLTCGRNQEAKDGKCITVQQKSPAESNSKASKVKSAQTGNSCPNDPTASASKLVLFTRNRTAVFNHPCGKSGACIQATPNAPIKCFWN